MIGLFLGRLLPVVRAVPLWAWLLVAALAWGGWQRYRANAVAAAYAGAQATAAKDREAALAKRLVITAQRIDDQQETIRHATKATHQARAAAAGTAAAAERLRTRLAAEQARARSGDPAAAGASATDRIAESLGRCVERYRYVAAAADTAVIAGQACERAYDSLTR